MEIFQERITRRGIPTSFVAVSGDGPVGTASLTTHDLEARQDLSPWLASVYVRPESRGKGLGAALVSRAVEEAVNLGVGVLYLFTFDKQDYYTRLGRTQVEENIYQGTPVTVMGRSLI